MKTLFLSVVVLGLSALTGFGQDAKGGQVLAESSVTAKQPTEKKPVLKPPTTTNQFLGFPVTYGGYLTDLKRAEKKRAMFNLRTPIDPVKDTENLWYYPGTEHVQGVVLFRIKF